MRQTAKRKISKTAIKRTCILVLGMHRSGTSALTRVLNIGGVDLPATLMGSGAGNTSGHWESNALFIYHDKMLKQQSSSWHDWRALDLDQLPIKQYSNYAKAIQKVIKSEYKQSRLFSVKDPRVCRFVPLFMDALTNEGVETRPIIAIRNPLEVCDSLEKRDGMSRTDAALLWLRHSLEAESETRRIKRTFVTYNQLLSNWKTVYRKISRQLEISSMHTVGEITPQVSEFLTTGQRHHARKTEEILLDPLLRQWVGATYEALLVLVSNPKSQKAMATLDQIAGEFNGSSAMIDMLFSEVRKERDDELADLKSKLLQSKNELKAKLQEASSDMQRMSEERHSLNVKLAANMEKAAHLTNYFNHQSQHPVRVGAKSLFFGIARMGYRLFPLPVSLKRKLISPISRIVRRIDPSTPASNFRAGISVSGMNELALENINYDAEIVVPRADSPVVSIIVPVYNQFEYTYRCLRSLANHESIVPFEIILLDDCSTDETKQKFSNVKNLKYIRNETNLGFLRNCNNGALAAKGEYLVFLNNDTQVLPGWLNSLYQTFFEHENVGLVGSKLIYPDGRLQEAGGIIWSDGSGWNWGKLEDPNHPRYNYVRDVDYVSGASMMISSKLFFALGSFDERYVPAYAEDADLAMSVRQAGARVVYQPHSAVVHYEGVSHGNDENEGVKSFQKINRENFVDKWEPVLKQHSLVDTNPLKAADPTARRHLLFVDHITPEPDKDAGSVEVLHILSIFQSLGYRVHFVPETNFTNIPVYTAQIQSKGMEAIYGPYYNNLREYLTEMGEIIDTILVFRVDTAERNFDTIKKLAPHARLIFHPSDLHYLRAEREAELKNDSSIARQALEIKNKELEIIRNSDLTFVVSEYEKELLSKEVPDSECVVIPMIRETSKRTTDFNQRSDVLFVGGFRHTPNVDAAEYLIEEIWPLVREKNISAKLRIVGSNMPDHFKKYAADDLEIVGYVDDIEDVFNQCRLSVAPLRYGAGTKGKVGTSLNLGVPCIGTSTSFEGMPLENLDKVMVSADTTQDFAMAIAELYSDEERWENISIAGMAYVDQHFNIEAVRKIIKDVLN